MAGLTHVCRTTKTCDPLRAQRHWHRFYAMNNTRRWVTLNTDDEFSRLFTGATVVRATTYPEIKGAAYLSADLFWELSDGSWLAMEVTTGTGCDTCGYGSGEKSYFHLPVE